MIRNFRQKQPEPQKQGYVLGKKKPGKAVAVAAVATVAVVAVCVLATPVAAAADTAVVGTVGATGTASTVLGAVVQAGVISAFATPVAMAIEDIAKGEFSGVGEYFKNIVKDATIGLVTGAVLGRIFRGLGMTLLKHEYFESQLMKKAGMYYEKAHEIVKKRFNFIP